MIRQAIAVPLLLRVRASLLEVENLFPSRKAPRHDLRFRVINRAPDQPIFAVPEGNDVAVRRISKNLQHFTGKHVVVPMQNSCSRFDDNSWNKRYSKFTSPSQCQGVVCPQCFDEIQVVP